PSHRIADSAWPPHIRYRIEYLENLVMLLFLYVHAAVRFRQELLRVHPILRIDGTTNAQRKPFHTTNLAACATGQLAQADTARFRRRGAQPGRDNHKLFATHTGHIVILSAGTLQSFRKMSKNSVTFKVAKAIINILKSVQVANHHSQRSVQTLASCQFAVKMNK